MSHQVFISHSSKDKAAADAVCSMLEAQSITCWVAPRDVRPGASYAAEIVRAIGDAQVMVLLHSKASNESPEVHREVERAGAKRIRIISIRIEHCEMSEELEYFLGSVQWIDATRPPMSAHLGPLCEAVRGIVSGSRAPLPGAAAIQGKASSPYGRSRKSFVLRAMALAIIAVGTVGVVRSRVYLDAAASVRTAAASPHGIPITGHPPPKTSVPQAAAAYASGLQNFRDGSLALARSDFQRAVSLDPSLAAANLRLSLEAHNGRATSMARASFAATSQFRANLDERDTVLLAFADAYTADPGDPDEMVRRMRHAAELFPDDAEVAFFLAEALWRSDHLVEGHMAARRAHDLDPQFATAFWMEAALYVWEYKMDDAAASLRRCLEISPMGASCLRSSTWFHDLSGQCTEMESEARRLLSIEPEGAFAHWSVGRALAALEKPVESVHAALDEATRLGGVAEGMFSPQVVEDAAFSLLTGDMERAETAGRELEKTIASSATEKDHGQAAEWLITIAEEEGHVEEAVRLAEEFEKHAPAWRANDPGGVRLHRLYLLHEQGRLPDIEFQEQRGRLYREGQTLAPLLASPRLTVALSEFFTKYAGTRGEAEDALAHKVSDTTPDLMLMGPSAFPLGRVFLLAGRVQTAIPLLREAANSCSILPTTNEVLVPSTITYLRAHLLLGQALAMSGDKTGACATYAKILQRWPHPTTRSVSVEVARAAMKNLHCAG